MILTNIIAGHLINKKVARNEESEKIVAVNKNEKPLHKVNPKMTRTP